MEDVRGKSQDRPTPTIEAVKAMATTGEIVVALREVFGAYTKPAVF